MLVCVFFSFCASEHTSVMWRTALRLITNQVLKLRLRERKHWKETGSFGFLFLCVFLTACTFIGHSFIFYFSAPFSDINLSVSLSCKPLLFTSASAAVWRRLGEWSVKIFGSHRQYQCSILTSVVLHIHRFVWHPPGISLEISFSLSPSLFLTLTIHHIIILTARIHAVCQTQHGCWSTRVKRRAQKANLCSLSMEKMHANVLVHLRGTPREHTNTYTYLQILNIHCFSLCTSLLHNHTHTRTHSEDRKPVFPAKLYSAEV